jgi:hypothetical protein
LTENSKLNLTQTIVGVALKRTPNGKFTPKALRDHQVGGLLLVVGTRTATWCVDYKPHHPEGLLDAPRRPRAR